VFIATNTIGVLCGVVYKNNTPDLYPGSSHSAVGWVATGIAAAQVSHLLVGSMTKLFNRLARQDEAQPGRYTLSTMREGFHSLQGHDDNPSGLSRQASIDVEATHALVEERDRDRNTSPSSRLYQGDPHGSGFTSGDDTCFEESDSTRALHHHPSAAFPKMLSTPLLSRMWRTMLLTYDLMDRTILIVGFVAFCTGLVTFWGIFVSAYSPEAQRLFGNKI
jgi:hypothetical protein